MLESEDARLFNLHLLKNYIELKQCGRNSLCLEVMRLLLRKDLAPSGKKQKNLHERGAGKGSELIDRIARSKDGNDAELEGTSTSRCGDVKPPPDAEGVGWDEGNPGHVKALLEAQNRRSPTRFCSFIPPRLH